MSSIFSNTVIASAGRVLNMALGVVLIALITRYLGADQYGLYTLLLAWGVTLQTAADFGLYLTLTRDIGRRPQDTARLVGLITALRLMLLLGLFTPAAVYIFLSSHHALWPAFFVLAGGFIVQSLSQLLMGVYQARGAIWVATVGDIAGRLVQLGAIVFFIQGNFLQSDMQIMYVAIAFTAGLVVAYILHSTLISNLNPYKLQFSGRQWKRIARVSWPLGLLLLINIIYFRADAVMLAFFRSSGEVGLYGLAYHIIERGLFFPAAFGGLLLPHIGRLAQTQMAQASRLVSQSLYALFVFALPGTALLALYAKPITVLLSGEEFLSAAPILSILSLALGVMFFGNIFGFVLVALGKQRLLLGLYVALAIGNVIANLFFIPRFGGIGAAITTVVTESIAMGVAGVLTYRLISFTIPPAALAGLVAITTATTLIAILLPDSWHIVLRILCSSAFFFATAHLFGLISKVRLNLLFSPKPASL